MQVPSDIFETLTVKRRTGQYTANRWVEGTESTVTMTAAVQPDKDAVKYEVEGGRAVSSIVIFTQSPIYALDEKTNQKGDRVYYNGQYYRVQLVDYYKLTPELTHYKAFAQLEQSK